MKYSISVLLLSVAFFGFSQDNWNREDKIASRIKGIKNTNQLIDEIKSFRLKDKRSQVRVAFTWIDINIKYDWNKYKKSSIRAYTPDETIEKRRGVCSDYATLFKVVLDSLSFENMIVRGTAKGYGYQQGDKFYDPNHDWNVIKDDSGKWHLFDVTWGSFYFDLDPEIMIYDHLPTQSEWQLLDTIVSKRKFEKRSILPRFYLEQGISIRQIKEACPSGECEIAEIFKLPDEFSFEVCQLPLHKKLKIGHKYTIAIKGGTNYRFLLRNGFRTKTFKFGDGIHSITFIPLKPFSAVSLLLEKRNTRWIFLKWKT